MLKVTDAFYGYSKKTSPVLQGLSFSLDDAKTGILLGPNGVGKSTLLKCIEGLLKVSSGSIEIDSENVLKMKRKERAKKIAYVPQSPELGSLSVYDAVRLGRLPYRFSVEAEHDEEKTMEALTKMGLLELLDRNVNELSGGERQKVALARALAQEATLLLLDEPTSSLDLKNQEMLISLLMELHKEKLSMLISIHDINTALRLGDSFYMFKEGKIAHAGDEMVVNQASILDVYGAKLEEKKFDENRYFIGRK
jgi:iron complex transport system ATP-binding protein